MMRLLKRYAYTILGTHTASLLINQGEDYLVVKERLGHASITTTIDTYSHLYPSKQKDLADKLDDLI